MPATHEPRFARIAAMVADPARSRMLAYLLTGEYASAGELAAAASVTPATASGHLGKLLGASIVICEPRGRHRYFKIAGEEVAHALEALAVVAERDEHDKAWAHPARKGMRLARRCYGHLAGKFGVALLDALRNANGIIASPDGYELTARGERWLAKLELRPMAPTGRRRYAYPCLDWSERKDHLAGQLGDQLCDHILAKGWMRRGHGRALDLTRKGQDELVPLLGVRAGWLHFD